MVGAVRLVGGERAGGRGGEEAPSVGMPGGTFTLTVSSQGWSLGPTQGPNN